MSARHLTGRYRRAIATITAICCLWLSSFGSLFHTDCVVFASEGPTTVGKSAPASNHALSVAEVKAAAPHAPHCLACEWQANSVAQAMPAYVLEMAPAVHTITVTTFSCYHSTTSISTPSRAPPTV